MKRLVACLALFASCHPSSSRPKPIAAAPSSAAVVTPIATPIATPEPEPIHMEELTIPGDLPAWTLRGSKTHDARYVFLPGMCWHPLGYAQSFQAAAAERGDMVTLQGDVSCGGPYRKWSYDFPAIEKRIEAVLLAAGIEARDLTLIGYSQGAEIAERLASRYPEKFTRVILIASPIVPSAGRLRHVDAAVLMAGTLDSQTNMREGLRALSHARIPSTFQLIPGAPHGQLGATPDATMAGAFAWIEKNSTDAVTPAAPVR